MARKIKTAKGAKPRATRHRTTERTTIADLLGDDAKSAKKSKAPKTPKAPSIYSGAPIPTSRLFNKPMPEFTKCTAVCWMILNDQQQTVTYANTYNGLLKSSYDPLHYTYPQKPKVIAKKLEEMIEVEDREEWPTFVTYAGGLAKRSR